MRALWHMNYKISVFPHFMNLFEFFYYLSFFGLALRMVAEAGEHWSWNSSEAHRKMDELVPTTGTRSPPEEG